MAGSDMYGNSLNPQQPIPSGPEQSNQEPVMNEAFLNSMTTMVSNVLTHRSEVFRKLFDVRRNIDDECGYPDSQRGYINLREYEILFDRESIANRVVSYLPKETWKVQPKLIEDENSNNETKFEKAWADLHKNLRGADSYLKSDKSNPIWYTLKKIDVLSGIGQYGVVLLGFNDVGDGRTLADECKPREGMKLMFMRAFQESLVDVLEVDQDITSPRFGRPTKYRVTFNDPRLSDDSRGVNPRGFIKPGNSVDVHGSQEVHWTRILHVADNTESSEIYGVPRLRPVFNRVWDLRKLYSGSAEMYWKGAFPGLSVESHPNLATELGNEVQFDKATARTEIEQYMNGLQRYLALVGMSVKSLSPQVVDPTPQIDTQLKAIAAHLGVSVRKLTGADSGGAYNDQDEDTHNELIASRQNEYVTPFIIAPFVDHLIYLKVLPKPEQYEVKWPDLSSQTSQEKSRVAFQRTQALAMYRRGEVEQIMAPLDFHTRILGLDELEARSVIENAEENYQLVMKRKMEEQELMASLNPQPEVVPAKGKMSDKADVGGSSTSKKPEVETMATRSPAQSELG